MNRLNRLLALLALPFALLSAHARATDQPQPPPEAYAACTDKAAAAACSVVFGDHTITGTCVAQSDGKLFCRPDRPPPPPPEAYAACANKKSSDACSKLACAPSGPPPG